MNYIGSKKRLAKWLLDTMQTCTELRGSFLDAFGGTSIVSQEIKPYMQVTCNDVEQYAYWLARHYIQNESSHEELIAELRTAEPIQGFIYANYASGRMYWTPENGAKIDGIRTRIEQMSLTEDEKAAALAALLEAADSVANTASVYGAYLKQYKQSAKRALTLNAIKPATGQPGLALNQDILTYTGSGDVAYLDPPYNSRHYGSNYHLLNTIVTYTTFEPKGVTGLPDYYKSPFCSKVKAESAMRTVLTNLDYKYIFISYNDEGILSLDKLESICSEHGDYTLHQTDYARFKSDTGRKQKQDSTIEYLHCIKR